MNPFIFPLFLFCLVNSPLYSQREWAPLGTEWYYTYGGIFGPPVNYVKTKAIGDTLIAGKPVRILRSIIISEEREEFFEDILIHQEDDRIFRWANGSFRLLYDFTLEEGDTIAVYVPDPTISDPGDSLVYLVVDRLGQLDISGNTYRGQFLEALETELAVYGAQFSGWAYESIGSLSYFVPVNQLDCDGACPWPLRCFADSEVSINWFDIPCDTIIPLISSTFNIETGIYISLFPNPVSSGQDTFISFEKTDLNELVRISLLDLSGKRIKNEIRYLKEFVDISTKDLLPGLYFLVIETNQFRTVKKLIVRG